MPYKIKRRNSNCRCARMSHIQICRLELSYDAELRTIDEFHNVAYLFTIRHLFLNLHHCIEHRCLSMENQTISVCYVSLDLLTYTIVGEHCVVNTAIVYRVTACYDIGRYIPTETASALHHCRASYTCSRVSDDT